MNYNEAERWFKRYLQAHKIISVVMAFFFFVWAFVDTFAIIRDTYYGMYYGVLNIPNAFLNLIIWFLIGAICVVAYYIRSQHVAVYRYLVVKNLSEIKGKTTRKGQNKPDLWSTSEYNFERKLREQQKANSEESELQTADGEDVSDNG